MRIATLVVLAGLLPAAAVAAPVLVRTAEHDGFTRVVVDFPDRPDWAIEGAPGGFVLKARTPVAYDLSDVYRRIQRMRVASLADAGEGALKFELNCDCGIETTELSNEHLIIDIRDAGGMPVPEPVDPVALTTTAQELVVLPGLLRDVARGDPIALLRRARLKEVRENVEHGVERSVAQGLVHPSRPGAIPSSEIVIDPASGKPDLSAFENVRVGTQIDRDRTAMTAEDAECPAPEQFAIEGWGDAGAGIGSLSPLRRDLYDESGVVDPETAERLAKGLLYFSFGAEAANVVRIGGNASPEAAVLGQLARIMDGGTIEGAAYPHATCGGSATLWAILGDVAAPDGKVQSALAAFERLPEHLRAYLGPRLARRLLAAGHAEEARLVERAVARLGEETGPEAAIAAAEISAHDGRDGDARDLLEGVATSGLPQAGGAMADLLASLGADDEAASTTLIAQATALSFELEGPVAAKLDAEITLALARNARFVEAMDYLYSRPFEAERRADLRDDVYDMVHAAGDIAFLESAAQLLDRPTPGEVEALAIAARLADHGLVAQSRAYLDGIAGPPRQEERLIRARLAETDGDAESAETYLVGLDGPEAEAIRDGLNLPPRQPVSLDAPAVTAETFAPPLAGVPSLPQRSRALLDESAALRAALANLTGADRAAVTDR